MSMIDGLVIDPENVIVSLNEYGYEFVTHENGTKRIEYFGKPIYEVEPNGVIRFDMITWNETQHPTLLEIIRVHSINNIENGIKTFLNTGTISGGTL